MTIDYISDTHFNAHFTNSKLLKKQFAEHFSSVFQSKQSDTLILAGDIGEDNDENLAALRLIRDEIGYHNIVLVLGNHDWHLTTPVIIERYSKQSINRVNEFKAMIDHEVGIHLLDGDVIEIDGINIGGTMGWYDGIYVFKHLNPFYQKDGNYLNRYWKDYFPDYDAIRGCCDTYNEFCASELTKIERVYTECDVMVTHINPSVDPRNVAMRYKKEDSTGFFCFDGEKFLKETTAKYWVYGHTHIPKDFEAHGVKVVNNPYGYPGEYNRNFKVKSIEVK